jgi:hypothetical protein
MEAIKIVVANDCCSDRDGFIAVLKGRGKRERDASDMELHGIIKETEWWKCNGKGLKFGLR